MILDQGTFFGDNKALNTGAAGTYLLGNVVDLGATPTTRNLGKGLPPLYFVSQVAVTATSGGSATLQVILASDDAAAIATDGTATAHYTSAAIAVATLVAGYRIVATPLPSSAYERYLGVLQVTAVAAFTAGKLDNFITSDLNAGTTIYPDASN